MQVTEFLSQVNSTFRGSDDDVPAEGSSDYVNWLLTANRKKDEWARDAKQTWESNFQYEKPNEPGTVVSTATTALVGTNTYFTDYNVGDRINVSGETERTIATITDNSNLTVTVAFANSASAKTFTHKTIIIAGVQSYSVHRQFLNPATKVFGVLTTQDIRYKISKPQEGDVYCDNTYISGKLPKILTFQDDILSTDQIVGGELKMPGYYIPDNLVNATDEIPVDDPMWMVIATAASLSANDLTYSDKSPDLQGQANNLYSLMVSANRRGTYSSPRVAPTNVNRIRDTRGEGYGSSWDNT